MDLGCGLILMLHCYPAAPRKLNSFAFVCRPPFSLGSMHLRTIHLRLHPPPVLYQLAPVNEQPPYSSRKPYHKRSAYLDTGPTVSAAHRILIGAYQSAIPVQPCPTLPTLGLRTTIWWRLIVERSLATSAS
jgi:hypothetical protein